MLQIFRDLAGYGGNSRRGGKLKEEEPEAAMSWLGGERRGCWRGKGSGKDSGRRESRRGGIR